MRCVCCKLHAKSMTRWVDPRICWGSGGIRSMACPVLNRKNNTRQRNSLYWRMTRVRVNMFFPAAPWWGKPTTIISRLYSSLITAPMFPKRPKQRSAGESSQPHWLSQHPAPGGRRKCSMIDYQTSHQIFSGGIFHLCNYISCERSRCASLIASEALLYASGPCPGFYW